MHNNNNNNNKEFGTSFTTSDNWNDGMATKTVSVEAAEVSDVQITNCEINGRTPTVYTEPIYFYGKYPNGQQGYDPACLVANAVSYVSWVAACTWCNTCELLGVDCGSDCPVNDPNPLDQCYGPLYDQAMVTSMFDFGPSDPPPDCVVDIYDTNAPTEGFSKTVTIDEFGGCPYTGPLGDDLPDSDIVWDSAPTVGSDSGPAPSQTATLASDGTYVSDNSANYPGFIPNEGQDITSTDEVLLKDYTYNYEYTVTWNSLAGYASASDSHYCL